MLRLKLFSFNQKMFLYLLIITFSFNAYPKTKKSSSHSTSSGEIDSALQGPTHSEDLEVSWKEGLSAFSENKFQEALPYFKRIVLRYPGQNHFLKSHFYLGRIYIEMGQPQNAVAPLKVFSQGSKDLEDKINGMSALANAYYGLGKFQESLLTCEEAEKLSRKAIAKDLLKPNILVAVLIQKTLAYRGLNRESQAEITSIGAYKLAKEKPEHFNTEEKASAVFNYYALKLWMCSLYLSDRKPIKLSEEQTKEQHLKRGLCLLESVKTLKEVWLTSDPKNMSLGIKEFMNSIHSYKYKTKNPPDPLPLQPKDRTAKQKKSYLKELSDFLWKDYLTRINEINALISHWSEEQNISPQLANDFKTKILPEITSYLKTAKEMNP